MSSAPFWTACICLSCGSEGAPMIARKLGWLAAEGSLMALWVRFGSSPALALAAALALIPLVSIPLNLYLRRKIRLKLTAEPNLRKGAAAEAVLKLENPTLLPVRMTGILKVQNLLNGMTSRGRFELSGPGMETVVNSRFCGRLRLTVENARLYDCLGLIGVAVNCREKCHITVQPDGFETNISLVNETGGVAEAEQYSQYRPGPDLTEVFQLREYVPGDSPRQIHWKLSGKLDRLIVRDPGLPIVQDLLIFWERICPEETPESIDAQAEVIISIGRALLEQSVTFRLGWNDTADNRCILHEIRELDDLIAVVPRLLSAAGGGCDRHAGAALLMQTHPEDLCSHMVYVAHTPAPEVLDWRSFGYLTVLAAADGYDGAIRFDETNYPAQLAALEL